MNQGAWGMHACELCLCASPLEKSHTPTRGFVAQELVHTLFLQWWAALFHRSPARPDTCLFSAPWLAATARHDRHHGARPSSRHSSAPRHVTTFTEGRDTPHKMEFPEFQTLFFTLAHCVSTTVAASPLTPTVPQGASHAQGPRKINAHLTTDAHRQPSHCFSPCPLELCRRLWRAARGKGINHDHDEFIPSNADV